MASFSVKVEGMSAIIGSLTSMVGVSNTPEFRQALLNAATAVEFRAKANLQEMVYSNPEGWYKRKHSGGGLYGTTQASGKIERERGGISTAVVSTNKYAVYVHFGTGIYAADGKGRKTPWVYRDEDGGFHRTVGVHPKPYLSQALKDSEREVIILLSDAVDNLSRRKK